MKKELFFLFPLSPPNSQQRLSYNTKFYSVYLFPNNGSRTGRSIGKKMGRSELLNTSSVSQVSQVFTCNLWLSLSFSLGEKNKKVRFLYFTTYFYRTDVNKAKGQFVALRKLNGESSGIIWVFARVWKTSQASLQTLSVSCHSSNMHRA